MRLILLLLIFAPLALFAAHPPSASACDDGAPMDQYMACIRAEQARASAAQKQAEEAARMARMKREAAEREARRPAEAQYTGPTPVRVIPRAKVKSAHEIEREAFEKTCSEKRTPTSDCESDQYYARERLSRLAQDPRDGWAVKKCTQQWRMPGSDRIDYTQAEYCVKIQVAAAAR